MRILHVISTLAPEGGGTTEAVRLLHQTLISQGHASEVVCCGDPEAAWVATWGSLAHVLGKGRYGWGYHPQWIPWLTANVHRFNAVIVHGLWLYPSYAVWKVLWKKQKVKNRKQKEEENCSVNSEGNLSSSPLYFVFPHGMLDPWFQKAPERRLKAWRNEIYWRLIEQKVVGDAAGLLFTCEEEMRLARTTFPSYQARREINVGYGIAEPPGFQPSMNAAFHECCPELMIRPYLLFLSRIHPKKGVDLLIRAYAELCKMNTTGRMPCLVIAGPGRDTDYGREMQKLANETCPTGSVLFPGMLVGNAKWGALYTCDAFILPSHQENFGIAVVEALACGKLVMISNKVNIWREILADAAGFVEDNTVEGTVSMLKKWALATNEEKNAWSLSAKRCFPKHFDISKPAASLVNALSMQSPLRGH